MLTLVSEAGWCPGCNSRLGATGEESRLGRLYMHEAGQCGLSFPAREGRQVSGLSFPAREGTFVDEKVLRAHRSSDKKWDQNNMKAKGWRASLRSLLSKPSWDQGLWFL